jgi:hypothetical protein
MTIRSCDRRLAIRVQGSACQPIPEVAGTLDTETEFAHRQGEASQVSGKDPKSAFHATEPFFLGHLAPRGSTREINLAVAVSPPAVRGHRAS